MTDLSNIHPHTSSGTLNSGFSAGDIASGHLVATTWNSVTVNEPKCSLRIVAKNQIHSLERTGDFCMMTDSVTGEDYSVIMLEDGLHIFSSHENMSEEDKNRIKDNLKKLQVASKLKQ